MLACYSVYARLLEAGVGVRLGYGCPCPLEIVIRITCFPKTCFADQKILRGKKRIKSSSVTDGQMDAWTDEWMDR